jgi:hypothetical protein
MDTYNSTAEPWIPIAHYVDDDYQGKIRYDTSHYSHRHTRSVKNLASIRGHISNAAKEEANGVHTLERGPR